MTVGLPEIDRGIEDGKVERAFVPLATLSVTLVQEERLDVLGGMVGEG